MLHAIIGRPLFDGTSTLNQIERIMAIVPQPTRTGPSLSICLLRLQILLQILKVSNLPMLNQFWNKY